jgi:hypothetical protein
MKCEILLHLAPSWRPAFPSRSLPSVYCSLKNVAFGHRLRIFLQQSVRQSSSAISSRDGTFRLKLRWYMALMKPSKVLEKGREPLLTGWESSKTSFFPLSHIEKIASEWFLPVWGSGISGFYWLISVLRGQTSTLNGNLASFDFGSKFSCCYPFLQMGFLPVSQRP